MLKLSNFFIFFILISIFSGCEQKTNQTNNQPQVIEVGFIKLKEEPITLQQELTGKVKARYVSEIRPQINGIIKEQLFIEGSKIKEGDILYKIDSATYQAAYNQAKASLESVKAQIETSKLKVQRYEDLVKFDGISKQELDDAKASYLQLLALLEEKKAALESAKINLERTQIKAPISGFIGVSNITLGSLVQANQTEALTTIRDTNMVFVDLNQSQSQLLNLRKLLDKQSVEKGSTEVTLILSDGSQYEHKGVLKLQELFVDESTSSVTLRALFPNEKGELLAGMFVKALINGAIDNKAFLLPQQAVSRDEKANPVVTIIKEDNSIKKQIITTQRVMGNKWVVTSGITSEDKIIIEGLNKINPKSKVNPIDVTNKYIENSKKD